MSLKLSSLIFIFLAIFSSLSSAGTLWYKNDTDEYSGARLEIGIADVDAFPASTSEATYNYSYFKDWNAVLDFRIANFNGNWVELKSVLGEVFGQHEEQVDDLRVEMFCSEDCELLQCGNLSSCQNMESESAHPQLVDKALLCRVAKEDCGMETSLFVDSSRFTHCCLRLVPNAAYYCDGSVDTNSCWRPRSYKTLRVKDVPLPAEDWNPVVDWLDSRPLSIALVLLVGVMSVALMFFVFKWRRAKKRAKNVALDRDRSAASPMFPLDPEHSAVVLRNKAKVLLAYYPDCDEFCSAVDSLANLLSADGHCEVTNMCGGLDALEPEDLYHLLARPDVTVLVIPSWMGKKACNVYFDEYLPGRILAPEEPMDTSYKLFYSFLFHGRSGLLRLKMNRVAVLGFHPKWREEHYDQALGGLRLLESFEIPENTREMLRWIHGCHSDVPVDPSRECELRHKINVFRKLIVTDDDYPMRHVLVLDSR